MKRQGTIVPWLAMVPLIVALAGCGGDQAIRAQADVEQLRSRITKVRHAVSETHDVIASSRGRPYLDELHLRLAELRSEEAQYHYHLAQQREGLTDAVHAPQVRFLKEDAINIYERILRENPDSELGDRILFNIASEYRELGNYEQMIATFRRLLDDERYTDSRYRNEALVVLGDHHLAQLEFGDAGRYYKGILNSPEGPLHGLASYKLAWVHVNEGDCPSALQSFEQAIDGSRSWKARSDQLRREAARAQVEAQREGVSLSEDVYRDPTLEGLSERRASVDVSREALGDLVYCYSTERPAVEIISYLRERASDRGAYVSALERAATRYAVMEETEGGAAVVRELLRLAPDAEDRIDDVRMLHAAVTRAEDYDQVGADVELIFKAVRRRASHPSLSEKARRRLLGEAEVFTRDLATKAQHKVSQGADPDPAAARRVAEAYRAYLSNLPDSEHRLAMTANLADTLALANEWLEAGRWYGEVAELTNDENERNEANYEAVAAFHHGLRDDRPWTLLERVGARAGLRKAGLAYLATQPSQEKALKIRFNIGFSYYDEGRYQKAVDLLTSVAYEFPGTPEAESAIQLVLDSHNTLTDYEGIVTMGTLFLSEDSPASHKLRPAIMEVVKAAKQRILDEAGLEESGLSFGRPRRFDDLMDRFRGTEYGLQVLVAAFVAARANGDIARMGQIADRMRRDYPNAEELVGLYTSLGRTAATHFDFDVALENFERAAKVGSGDRSQMLLGVGELQERLADFDGAERSYQRAAKVAESAEGRRAGALRLAKLYELQGKIRPILTVLSKHADSGDPEVLSRLGLAEQRLGRDEAQDHLDLALSGEGSDTASGRALYGLAEQLLTILEELDPEPSIEGVHELIDLVDQVESTYASVIRQGDSIYTYAAIARAARAYDVAARLMHGIRVTNVSGGQVGQINQLIKSRAQHFEQQRDGTLRLCATKARQHHRFDRPARVCLSGQPPEEDPAYLDPVEPRQAAQLRGADDLRAQLAANPEHLESLDALGRRYLEAGDAHVAMLIFARAVEAGGGPELLNRLGLAAARAGDIERALQAFSVAAEGGFTPAQRNFVTMLRRVGLNGYADEAQAAVTAGTVSPDQLLPSAR